MECTEEDQVQEYHFLSSSKECGTQYEVKAIFSIISSGISLIIIISTTIYISSLLYSRYPFGLSTSNNKVNGLLFSHFLAKMSSSRSDTVTQFVRPLVCHEGVFKA